MFVALSPVLLVAMGIILFTCAQWSCPCQQGKSNKTFQHLSKGFLFDLFGAWTANTSESCNFAGLLFPKSTLVCVFLTSSIPLWFKLTIQHCLGWECVQQNNSSLATSFSSSLHYWYLASCFPFSCMFLGKDGISVTHRYLPAFRVLETGGIRAQNTDF